MTNKFMGLVIGSGKLATHLKCYFAELNAPVYSWQRSSNDSANNSLQSLNDNLKNATHVYLAISDSAIEPFVKEHGNALSGKTLVHFSGALNIAGIFSAHPLMSFSEKTYSLKTYQEIPFALVAGEKSFSELFPFLSNPHFTISKNNKALYHALCVVSGNFPQMLWKEVFKEASQIGISPEYFKKYLHQCVENSVSYPEKALTGPLIRNDQQTIQSNLNSLQKSPLRKVYEFFVGERNSFLSKESQDAHHS